MDTRTDALVEELSRHGGKDRLREKTGLPLATYFSGLKLDGSSTTSRGPKQRRRPATSMFGTINSWLLWNLTGGRHGGLHLTDVTNASRTQLMNLATLDWDDEILQLFDIPRTLLPDIRSSSEVFGYAKGALEGVADRGADRRSAIGAARAGLPLAGRGEEHLWHRLFPADEHRRAPLPLDLRPADDARLQAGDAPAIYALEGSIAIAGALVQWLRDNLGIIASAGEIEALAGAQQTTATSISCPRSPASTRRIGRRARGGRSSASRDLPTKPTFAARRWRRPPFRRAKSSARW